MIAAVDARLPDDVRAALTRDAGRELEPFRPRMSSDAYHQACLAARARLMRELYGLPEIGV